MWKDVGCSFVCLKKKKRKNGLRFCPLTAAEAANKNHNNKEKRQEKGLSSNALLHVVVVLWGGCVGDFRSTSAGFQL